MPAWEDVAAMKACRIAGAHRGALHVPKAGSAVSSRVGRLSSLIAAVYVFGCDGHFYASTLFESHIIAIFVN
jgi:hypothetical protein